MGKNLSRAENRGKMAEKDYLLETFCHRNNTIREIIIPFVCAAMNDCVFSKVITVDFTSEKCEKANTYSVKTIAQEISSLRNKMH
jgi:hypothetical protein